MKCLMSLYSTGGMSVKSPEEVSIGMELEVSFALLTLPRIWVRAQVSWRKPDKTFGVRFDVKDERRMRIKEWIEAYLEKLELKATKRATKELELDKGQIDAAVQAAAKSLI